MRIIFYLPLMLALTVSAPVAAQCTVSEIIDRMVTPIETVENIAIGDAQTFSQGNDPADTTDPPEFIFTPEIAPAQRKTLRRVGRACSWTSDVSNCTFRRVARMALRGKEASYIYDNCSD
jgi:hypothetical protein